MSTPAKSALRKASLFYFVWVMFSYCTGGPFGLEDMVTTSGPGMTLVFLLVIPFFWCIPVSLVSAELTTALPVEGGFYRWVRAGFGDFWGFLAGWWNWCASFLLGSVYAVQFADYLGYYFPEVTGWRHYIVSLAIVALITYINVRGIQMVGKFAAILELFILLPVLVLVVIGLAKWHHNPFVPVIPPHQPTFHVFGVGLALGLWLYSGYEQCSTVAEEVDNPRRSYPLALALVVPMSIAAYFLPTLASLAALGNWQSWHTGFFPTAAQLIGGRWLGAWMFAAAMVTQVALLNGTILASTRMPFAMAEDGYLPHVLTGQHRRYGTPWIAIITSAVVYGLLALHSLVQLISIYNWLRVATTVMTVLAAWQLRRKKPDMPRPFVIPGGPAGLIYSVVAVVIMSAVALLGSDRYGLLWGPAALAVGPVVYFGLRARGGPIMSISLRDSRRAKMNSLSSPNAPEPARISAALLLLRIASALAFLYHGSSILFGAFDGPGPQQFAASHQWPAILAYLVGLAQVGGGLAVLTGIFFRIGAACIIAVMLGAIFMVHLPHGFNVGSGGAEYALTQLLLAIAFLLMGPGAYSLGSLLPAGAQKL